MSTPRIKDACDALESLHGHVLANTPHVYRFLEYTAWTVDTVRHTRDRKVILSSLVKCLKLPFTPEDLKGTSQRKLKNALMLQVKYDTQYQLFVDQQRASAAVGPVVHMFPKFLKSNGLSPVTVVVVAPESSPADYLTRQGVQ